MAAFDCSSCVRPAGMESTADSPAAEGKVDSDGCPPSDGQAKPFTPSRAYTTRKTLAQGALDFALLMANASQLKALVDIPSNHRDNVYIGLLVLLGLSITLQIATGLILLILGMMDPKDEKGHKRTEQLNNASVCLILLITVLNIFISAFGISYVDDSQP